MPFLGLVSTCVIAVQDDWQDDNWPPCSFCLEMVRSEESTVHLYEDVSCYESESIHDTWVTNTHSHTHTSAGTRSSILVTGFHRSMLSGGSAIASKEEMGTSLLPYKINIPKGMCDSGLSGTSFLNCLNVSSTWTAACTWPVCS